MSKSTVSQPSSQQHAFVLGATGSLGRAFVAQLLTHGWKVTALVRDTSSAYSQDSIQWVQGDALNSSDVLNASLGCDVIFHGVNPPGYKQWDRLILPMLKNTLAAAKEHKATVIVPGNVYNYGLQKGDSSLSEDAPQQPISKKGIIRKDMEQALLTFSASGGQVILVRCGDFFGERSQSSWFSQAMLKPNKPVKHVTNVSIFGVGHQWAYLPDVADTMMQLVLRRHELDSFADFHMAGHWDHDGMQMATTTAELVSSMQNRAVKIVAFPWWLLSLSAPFHRLSRELIEMKYLWQTPLRLDNKKLCRTIGNEPHTPLKQALREILVDG